MDRSILRGGTPAAAASHSRGRLRPAVRLARYRRVPARAGAVLRSQHAGELLRILSGYGGGGVHETARRIAGLAEVAGRRKRGVLRRAGALVLAGFGGFSAGCAGGVGLAAAEAAAAVADRTARRAESHCRLVALSEVRRTVLAALVRERR